MSVPREDALEACLQAMRQGASVSAALDQYPELAEELRPLLEAAQAATSLAPRGVPRHAVVRSRTRLLQRASSLKPRRGRWRLSSPLLVRPAMAILVVAVALTAGMGAVGAAAAQSLPGDSLYPAKLIAEDVLLQLASNPASRLRLEEAYLEQRAEEVRRLLALGRMASVSFVGRVEQTTTDGYVVDGIPVRVASDARRVGDIRMGVVIQVAGLTQPDGTVLAHELHLRAYDMFGVVESITPQAWIVAGVTFKVTADSVIEAGVTLGDQVVARIRVDDTGELMIESIRRFASPSPMPAPSATPSPKPSATATATPTGPPKTGQPEAEGERTETPESTDEPDDDSDGESPDERDFTGMVQAIGATQWTIGGEVVLVDDETEIRDDPQVGDTVRVKAKRRPDGSWWAERIEHEDD